MNAFQDWTIRRHRAIVRGLGASHAAAGGLAVVGVLAAIISVVNILGVHPMASSTSIGGVWHLPALAGATPGASASAGGAPSTSLTPPGSKLPVTVTYTGKPTRVRIPKISVNTSLEALGLDSTGALQPPSFTDAGWYAGGTVPGDVGPAIIAAHIDTVKGPSIFYNLVKLKAGDLVQVQRGGTWLTFTVVGSGRYPKTNFPTADVYGPTPTPQLRLITCGGSFNRSKHSYVDNIVVFAVLDQ